MQFVIPHFVRKRVLLDRLDLKPCSVRTIMTCHLTLEFVTAVTFLKYASFCTLYNLQAIRNIVMAQATLLTNALRASPKDPPPQGTIAPRAVGTYTWFYKWGKTALTWTGVSTVRIAEFGIAPRQVPEIIPSIRFLPISQSTCNLSSETSIRRNGLLECGLGDTLKFHSKKNL